MKFNLDEINTNNEKKGDSNIKFELFDYIMKTPYPDKIDKDIKKVLMNYMIDNNEDYNSKKEVLLKLIEIDYNLISYENSTLLTIEDDIIKFEEFINIIYSEYCREYNKLLNNLPNNTSPTPYNSIHDFIELFMDNNIRL